MCLLFQGAVQIKNSPSVARAKQRSLTQPGTDRLQRASVDAVPTQLHISVSVLGVSSTHRTCITLKAFCLNIYEILPGLKHSQFRRCAELCNRCKLGAGRAASGSFWG